MDDQELLRLYVYQRDERAFDELVKKYYSLVYRTVRVRLQDAQLAEDAVLTVFILLARKASSIGAHVVISGWLFKTAHLTACNAARLEQNRRKHEAEAINMAQETNQDEPEHLNDDVLAMIDDALMKLSETERNAVLLRIGQGLTIAETAVALRCSPDAANKRASRGLERLRRYCMSHGAVLTVTAIMFALTDPHAHAAPSSFTAAALNPAANGSQLNLLLKGAIKAMQISSMKAVVSVAIAFIIIGWAGYFAVNHGSVAGVTGVHTQAGGSMLAEKNSDIVNTLSAALSNADKNVIKSLAEGLVSLYNTASRIGKVNAVDKINTLAEDQSGHKVSKSMRELANVNIANLLKAGIHYTITGEPHLVNVNKSEVPYEFRLQHDCIVHNMTVEGKELGIITLQAGIVYNGAIRYRNDNPSQKWLYDGGM